jgi:hypothetical protein
MNPGINRRTNYVLGFGASRNGWKFRAGINFSATNFENSAQVRAEGYLTYLPYSNPDLYFNTGGMIQNDKNWGETYQVNEEAGIKISRLVWLETGIVLGNAFQYARNQGYIMNNSYLIPATTLYCNIISAFRNKITLNISPYYSKNKNYSWNLISLYRDNELNPNTFGLTIKLIYNNR